MELLGARLSSPQPPLSSVSPPLGTPPAPPHSEKSESAVQEVPLKVIFLKYFNCFASKILEGAYRKKEQMGDFFFFFFLKRGHRDNVAKSKTSMGCPYTCSPPSPPTPCDLSLLHAPHLPTLLARCGQALGPRGRACTEVTV